MDGLSCHYRREGESVFSSGSKWFGHEQAAYYSPPMTFLFPSPHLTCIPGAARPATSLTALLFNSACIYPRRLVVAIKDIRTQIRQ